ncbi:MAG: hypothetical protein FWE23_08765 [Chitinivibrionia bacterium]|nr:hypothetical protein [Chitinivibrionia bacterium]
MPATLSMNVRAYSRALSGGTISISRIRGGTITDNVGGGLTFGALGGDNELTVDNMASITTEDFDRIANADTEKMAMEMISALIEAKARRYASIIIADDLSEERAANEGKDARRCIRKKLAGLSEIDPSYSYDWGDKEKDYMDIEDAALNGHVVGKLVRYLSDKGYTISQISDMSNAELYALAARVNAHENLMVRNSLMGAPTANKMAHPVIVSETVEASVPSLDGIYSDPIAWEKYMDEAVRTNNRARLDAIRNYERSIVAKD